MHDIEKLLISPAAAVRDALENIERGSLKIALVSDERRRLLGVVTDGDIRRGILRNIDLGQPVSDVMNGAPSYIRTDESDGVGLALMRQKGIHHLPVLDAEGRIVRLLSDTELLQPHRQPAWILIMAGGLGSRLKPLTDKTPKPLLPVGGRPLMEIMIENLIRQGFDRFFLSVNYRADMIASHFGDGAALGVSIEYLVETERLGTAGALCMIRDKAPDVPVIVINGDILTTLDARLLLMFHREQKAPATVCVCEHTWRVPYGVVMREANGGFMGIEEKPLRRELISAGINVFSPGALEVLPQSGSVDMPNFLASVAAKVGPPKLYPLREYWLDIGRLDDLARAESDVLGLFGPPTLFGETP